MSPTRGILIAADIHIQWLLPWFWERYTACNTLPIACVDLGLDQKGYTFLQDKATIIPLPALPPFPKPKASCWKHWEAIYGSSLPSARNAWLKKPASCLLSPFEETVWLDLDCEVLSPLEPIFAFIEKHDVAVQYGFPERPIPGLEKESQEGVICNSGVIVFRANSVLLQKWAEEMLTSSSTHLGDETLLSSLLLRFPHLATALPTRYNHAMVDGVPLDASIIHWKGEWGKAFIQAHGGLKPLLLKAPWYCALGTEDSFATPQKRL